MRSRHRTSSGARVGRGATAWVLTFLGSLFGCSDGTTPQSPTVTGADPAITVEVRTGTPSTSFVQTAAGQVFQCDVALTAIATGTAGIQAQWEDATLRFFAVTDRSSPIDSMRISREQMREHWNAAGIRAGETQQAHWRFRTPEPFGLTGTFRYSPGPSQPLRTATFEVACVVEEVPAGPLRIQNIGIEAATDDLEVGDRIAVTYTVRGSVKLVETGIRVSGSFDQVVKQVEGSYAEVRRTLHVGTGPSAKLGERVRVQAYAIDAEGQEAVSEIIDGPVVVDRTPPAIIRVFLRPFEPNFQIARLMGKYADTDTLRLWIWAGDNHRLEHIVYEIGAPVNARDSVPATINGIPVSEVAIPVRREWVGAPSFTVHVRDAAGLASTAYTSPPDSLQIYPTRERPRRQVEIDGAFEDVALDLPRSRMYLALPDASAVAVLSLRDLATETRIPLTGRPVSLDLAPDGRTVAVALMGERALAFLDPARPADPPRIVPLAGAAEGYRPRALRYTRDGRVMVLAQDPGWGLNLLEYTPATGTFRVHTPQMPGSGFPAMERTADYTRIVFTASERCGLVYVAATDQLSDCRRVETDGRLSVSRDGTRFARGFTVHGSDLEPLRSLALEPHNLATTGISPDGTNLFISSTRGLIRARIVDDWYLERIPWPPIHRGAILFSEDGRVLYAAGRHPELNATRTRVFMVNLD